jgi:hypothetical protein
MAKGAFEDILVLGLFGGAAYLAWNWWSSLSAPAQSAPVQSTFTPAGTVGTTPAPTPTTQTTPVSTGPVTGPTPSLVTQSIDRLPVSSSMQTWANNNGMGSSYVENGNSANAPGLLDADHWSAIYTYVTGNTIDGTTFDSVFFPNGRPSDVSQNPVYSAPQFISMLVAGGGAAYAGLSGPAPRLIPVPMILGGQRHTMNVPAGTTPAQLQAMLRGR